jgi:hypothetical protein
VLRVAWTIADLDRIDDVLASHITPAGPPTTGQPRAADPYCSHTLRQGEYGAFVNWWIVLLSGAIGSILGGLMTLGACGWSSGMSGQFFAARRWTRPLRS